MGVFSRSPPTLLSASLTSVMSHQDWGVLSKDEAVKIEKDLEDGNLLKVVSDMRRPLELVSQTPVNIAVTGESGNGMSTFINALREIGHEEEASAPTGVVTTTETRAAYSSPLFPKAVLWDLPGTGVATDTLQEYHVEMQFSQYDLFIIIASQQFSMNHVMLAKTIADMGKKFYIVWTKLDLDLSSSTLPGCELQQTIKNHILRSLQKQRVCEPPIFLVSSLKPSSHDFPGLRDTLQRDLSRVRCDGPLQHLMHACEKIISHRVASMQRKITLQPLQGFLGFWYADDLAECLEAYRSVFGVNGEALRGYEQSKRSTLTDYTSVMRSHDVQRVRWRDWKLWAMTFVVTKMFFFCLSLCPGLRTCVIPYFRQMKHRRCLKIVAEETKTVLGKMLRDSVMPCDTRCGKKFPADPAGSLSGGPKNWGVGTSSSHRP